MAVPTMKSQSTKKAAHKRTGFSILLSLSSMIILLLSLYETRLVSAAFIYSDGLQRSTTHMVPSIPRILPPMSPKTQPGTTILHYKDGGSKGASEEDIGEADTINNISTYTSSKPDQTNGADSVEKLISLALEKLDRLDQDIIQQPLAQSTQADSSRHHDMSYHHKIVDEAFNFLLQGFSFSNGMATGLNAAFERVFRTRIKICQLQRASTNGNPSEWEEEVKSSEAVDRMGLAGLLSDQGRYSEAANELRAVLELSSSSVSMSTDTTTNPQSSTGMTSQMKERASAMMFRSLAGICNWENYESDSQILSSVIRNKVHKSAVEWMALRNSIEAGDAAAAVQVPALHPFEALKWPCINLEDSTNIARMYAMRATQQAVATTAAPPEGQIEKRNIRKSAVGTLSRDCAPPVVKVSRKQYEANQIQRKIKLGYISPDFTGNHPLAFLMQDYFRFHDSSKFDVHLYSLNGNDDDNGRVKEVRKIKEAVTTNTPHQPLASAEQKGRWKVFQAGSTPQEIATTIMSDQLDIIIDLCGYTGTSTVAEVLACIFRIENNQDALNSRNIIKISYMGFPGSSGAPYMDYMIVDDVVVPRSLASIRKHYTEDLIYMPHSYFVNSHRHCIVSNFNGMNNGAVYREKYGLPENGFVYCCHNRSDKIDPSTFRIWIQALRYVREQGIRDGDIRRSSAVLWLLSSGEEMEKNMLSIGNQYGLGSDCFVFAAIVPREEHLARLELADLFLDTPAYNAHTVGCDALFAGVPMVSLLRPMDDIIPINSYTEVATEKLASRVGASLLHAAGLQEMIVPNMNEYGELMIRCAADTKWYSNVTDTLNSVRRICPLFDTERWVRNLEVALAEVALNDHDNDAVDSGHYDIVIVDDA